MISHLFENRKREYLVSLASKFSLHDSFPSHPDPSFATLHRLPPPYSFLLHSQFVKASLPSSLVVWFCAWCALLAREQKQNKSSVYLFSTTQVFTCFFDFSFFLHFPRFISSQQRQNNCHFLFFPAIMGLFVFASFNSSKC